MYLYVFNSRPWENGKDERKEKDEKDEIAQLSQFTREIEGL